MLFPNANLEQDAVLSQGGPRDAAKYIYIEIYSGIARFSLR